MYTDPFSFRAMVGGASPVEIIFLFVPDNSTRKEEVDVVLNRILRDGNISPDLVVFVYLKSDHDEVSPVLKDEYVQERFNSIQRCKAVLAVWIEDDGLFGSPESVFGEGFNKLNLSTDELFNAYRKGGMGLLSRREGVVVSAPPGSYFLKPSGNRQTYFIRAALLCRTSVEASYVATLMLRSLAIATKQFGAHPNILLVDTLGIAYLAYALAEIAIRANVFKRRPEIRSFGSYGGIKRIKLGASQRAMFLISASTSGKLCEEIVEHLGDDAARQSISTLLGSFESAFPSLIFKLTKDFLPVDNATKAKFETLSEIRVHGEDFLFSPGSPNVVDLKHPQMPKGFSQRFPRLQGKGLIHHFRKAKQGKNVKPFLIYDSALVKDVQFITWVQSQAVLRVPIAVKRVIYQDDAASRVMGELLLNHLEKLWSGVLPILTSIKELEALEHTDSEPVVVVAAVAGSGMELMRICRELRRYQPNGGRQFLIGALLARSNRQLQHMLSSLKRSVEPTEYVVSTWCEFSPARLPIEQMHERERALWGHVTESEMIFPLSTAVKDYAGARKQAVDNDGMPTDDFPVFPPFISPINSVGSWAVGETFALWASKIENRNCPVDVLFTVACWLQNARESGEFNPLDRLSDGGFQHAVIGPDCFLRFTDPVIQASILRCAQDSELNYLASDELSARASEIVVKFIELREHARLEFLFALYEGRMRLKDKHLLAVADAADDDCCELTKLLSAYVRKRYLV